VRDIATHFNFSVKAAHDHLRALEAKQVIRTTDGISRSIEIIGEEFSPYDEMIQVPVIGSIAAGTPLMSEENTEYLLPLPSTMLSGGRNTYFALKVRGESMIEDGIFDGDYVFVKKTPAAGVGDIVVAMIEGEATVKRYYPEGDRIRFQPANANMSPIIVRRSEFKSVDIIGIVVGVYRKL